MRKSRAKRLCDTDLGQHLALSAAAHLAGTQLFPTNGAGVPTNERLDLVAAAIVRVAPVYVDDLQLGRFRELTPVELQGATVSGGATMLKLTSGQVLGGVAIKRGDLRKAIAILKATGVPGVSMPPPPVARVKAPEPKKPILEQVAELESLLFAPRNGSHVEKVNTLALQIARNAPDGRVANLAMRLMSAVHEARPHEPAEQVSQGLATLRAAVEEVLREGPKQ